MISPLNDEDRWAVVAALLSGSGMLPSVLAERVKDAERGLLDLGLHGPLGTNYSRLDWRAALADRVLLDNR